jgi:hypothetical protein
VTESQCPIIHGRFDAGAAFMAGFVSPLLPWLQLGPQTWPRCMRGACWERSLVWCAWRCSALIVASRGALIMRGAIAPQLVQRHGSLHCAIGRSSLNLLSQLSQ